MNIKHTTLWLIFTAGLFAVSGANCQHLLQPQASLPRTLPPSPTLTQVVEAVNRNHGQIQSFYTNQASLSGQGFGSLRATVAFQRPRNFRLYAGTGLMGPELDFGSNDTLFWFWSRQSNPPAVHFCRHDQFAASPARQSIPLPPDRLIEALGVTSIDPARNPQGPFPLAGDRLQVNTIQDSPDGPLTKVLVIDGAQGWILQQHLYNQQGCLLASAVASRYRQDPGSGLWMPQVVEISLPPTQFSMRLDLGPVQINRLTGIEANLWARPYMKNTPDVDLGNPNLHPPATPAPYAGQR